MRPFLLALAAGAAFAPCVRAAEQRYFDDAALRAVQFIDAKEGWAVGDEGVVWHTIDGGDHWERQATGVRASLRSLHFLDAYRGWIAGREELPHGGGSVGVLLRTEDGGVSWRRILINAIPGLNHIRFGDTRTGYALGDGSEQYPTGVFKTTDGGRSWQPVKGPRSPAWLAGDFKDGKSGALTGAWSRLATLNEDGFSTAKVDPLGVRTPLDVALRDGRGLAVGQGGLLLSSASGGARWGPLELKLPREALSAWDFRAVHWVRDHVWVVGRPGSVVLHSADRGAGWEILKTGQPLPLNAVHFFDEQRGWAVGELGTVLATRDGGKTWKAQRRGGQRAAVLFVHGDAAGLPVDTVAVLGMEEGHLAACVRLAAPDPRSAPFARASDPQRFAAAARHAGAAGGEVLWQFPLPQHLAHADRAELLKSWGQLHGTKTETEALAELVRQMTLALRTWRPDVVVTDHPDARVTGCAAGALAAQALHEAFAAAADPKAFPEQIEHLGLQPWRVARLFALWDRAAGADVTVDAKEDLPRLQTSPCEFAEHAGDLLADEARPLPAQRYYKLLDSAKAGEAPHGLMDGLPSGAGVACRTLPPLTEIKEEVVKINRTRRTLRALADSPVEGLAEPDRLLGLLKPALGALPDERGAAALFATAGAFARRGRWDLAREAFVLMTDRYPAHPRAAEAYRWLIRYTSSGEARHREELRHFVARGNTTVVKPQGGPPGAVVPAGFKQGPSGAWEKDADANPKAVPGLPQVLQNQQLRQLKEGGDGQGWYRQSVDLGKRLAAFGPLFASDPPTQFCLQAARRRLGQLKEAQEYYAWFKTTMPDGPWRDVAAAEVWLNDHNGPPPRPTAVCRQTATRPFLDGKFDEACWEGLPPLALRDAAEETAKEYPTQAWFAYDSEFLYIALRCRHPRGKQVAPVKPRPRDADLRGFDRVSILLDLDRDYSTCYHLQIDQRGCVCEDCWGDRSWDPQWFVAVHSEADCWQVEAAIPLKELTGERPGTGTVWACNVARVLPGRGVQGWSLPAGVEPRPEGMGLLFFRPEVPRQEPRPMPPAR